TCGMSPERFYESIRRFEFSNDGKNQGDVETTIEKYRRVRDGQAQADEPELIQIFEPFKHHTILSSYADEDIVRLILKCMLYKAKNTFYTPYSAEKTPGSKPIADLLAEIERLEREYTPYLHTNPLITLEADFTEHQTPDRFSHTITTLQEQTGWELRF